MIDFFLNLILFLIFCSPGIPIGIWLCGKNIKDQPEGLFYGFLLGHLISTSLTLLLGYFFSFSWLTLILYSIFLGIWLIASLRSFNLSWNKKVPLRPWGRRDYLVLFTSLIFFLVLVVPPQLNMGRETPLGYAFYGSLASDSLRNLAIIAELSKGEIPPQNPYFSGETLHYYWLSFLAPAIIYKILGKDVSLQNLLTWHTLFAGSFFLIIFFSTLRLYTRRVFFLGFGMFLVLLAANYKGFYLWWTFPGDTRDFLDQVLHYEIEASALRIWRVALMGLYRYLLLAPQHLFALAFFLMGWTIYLAPVFSSPVRTNFKLTSPWVSGHAGIHMLVSFVMGALFGYSGFIGLAALLWYGGYLFISALINKETVRGNLIGFLVAVGVLFIPLLAFYGLEKVVPGRGNLYFDINETFLANLTGIFLLNLGPGFVLGTLGIPIMLWMLKIRAFPNLWLMIICFLLFTGVVIQNFWEVTTKSSLILLLNLAFFSVFFLDTLCNRFRRSGIIVSLLAVFLCLPAVLTVLLDAYIHTRSTSPKYTEFVSPEDMKALLWIRGNLPEQSRIVDAPRGFSRDDERVYYAKIASFAHRRTILGYKLEVENQIPKEQVTSRKREVDTFFETHNLAKATEIAKRLGIQYVYVGPVEREYYPLGLSKFEDFKNLFRRIYHQDGVSLYQVLDGEPALITLRLVPLKKTSYQTKEILPVQITLQNQNYTSPLQVELVLRLLKIEGRGSKIENQNEKGLASPDSFQSFTLQSQFSVIKLDPGEERTMNLVTQAPENPGTYQVEITGKILLEEESKLERVTFQTENLHYNTGDNISDPGDSSGVSRVGIFGQHIGGFLTYGPYMELPAGEYLALFRLKGEDFQPGKRLATLEVMTDKRELARVKLFGKDFIEPGVFQEFKVPFTLDKAGEVEFRTYFHGLSGKLFVDNITVLVPKNLDEQNLVVFKKLDSSIRVD